MRLGGLWYLSGTGPVCRRLGRLWYMYGTGLVGGWVDCCKFQVQYRVGWRLGRLVSVKYMIGRRLGEVWYLSSTLILRLFMVMKILQALELETKNVQEADCIVYLSGKGLV